MTIVGVDTDVQPEVKVRGARLDMRVSEVVAAAFCNFKESTSATPPTVVKIHRVLGQSQPQA